MSWSVQFIGKPGNIADALQKQSTVLTGKSKEEFDAALPNFIGLLKQNYSSVGDPVLNFTASGHGHDGYNTCSVKLESLGGNLV